MRPVDPRLVIVFIWILACAAATWELWRGRTRERALPGLAAVLAAGLLLRLVPALVLPRGASYEMAVFREAAQAFLSGQNVYLLPIAHPYLPLHLYWLAAAERLTTTLGVSFPFWTKVPGIVADTVLIALVYQAGKAGPATPEWGLTSSRRPGSALLAAWLYACNPVTILVCAYQGQFDSVPLSLMFAAWLVIRPVPVMETGRDALGREDAARPEALRPTAKIVGSAVLLGLAVLAKIWPLLLLPIVWLRLPRGKARIAYTLVVLLVPVAGVLLYGLFIAGSPVPIFARAMGIGAIPGWWGFSAPLNVLVELTGQGGGVYEWGVRAGKILAAAGGLLAVWLTRRQPAPKAVLYTILVLFALVPNLGLQSLSWVICWTLAAGLPVELAVYVAGVFAHMLVSYWGIHLTDGLFVILPDLAARVIIQLSSLTAWGAILWWLIRRLCTISPIGELLLYSNRGRGAGLPASGSGPNHTTRGHIP